MNIFNWFKDTKPYMSHPKLDDPTYFRFNYTQLAESINYDIQILHYREREYTRLVTKLTEEKDTLTALDTIVIREKIEAEKNEIVKLLSKYTEWSTQKDNFSEYKEILKEKYASCMLEVMKWTKKENI